MAEIGEQNLCQGYLQGFACAGGGGLGGAAAGAGRLPALLHAALVAAAARAHLGGDRRQVPGPPQASLLLVDEMRGIAASCSTHSSSFSKKDPPLWPGMSPWACLQIVEAAHAENAADVQCRMHCRRALGWLHHERGVPLAELRLSHLLPSSDRAGVAAAFDYVQWLANERGVSAFTQGNCCILPQQSMHAQLLLCRASLHVAQH